MSEQRPLIDVIKEYGDVRATLAYDGLVTENIEEMIEDLDRRDTLLAEILERIPH